MQQYAGWIIAASIALTPGLCPWTHTWGTIWGTHQALYWEVPGFKRGPGRPRTNWRGIVKKDLRGMGFTREETEVAALNRQEWRRSVAQYVHVDVGRIKSNRE